MSDLAADLAGAALLILTWGGLSALIYAMEGM